MNEETQKALDELREFTRKEEDTPKKPPALRHVENPLTWKDIALGVYVGGLALAATSTILWLIFAGLFIASIH